MPEDLPPLKSLPPNLVAYQRTPDFTEATIPGALRRRHTTKAGVWARICVLRGSLRYLILEPHPQEQLLSPGSPGVVEPGIPHQVEPVGEVQFFVEFLRHAG
jgi:tellurite resistance-related uncharacterized protein